MDCADRNFARMVRKIYSSSALESYGPLLSNEPSLVKFRAVFAMIQHETSSLTLDVKSMKHKTMQFSFVNQQSLSEGVRPRPLSGFLDTSTNISQYDYE